MSNSKKVRFMAVSAVIAAMYAGLTYLAAAVNLAYGPVQFRFSEALTVLPAFTPAAGPGLAMVLRIAKLNRPVAYVERELVTLATFGVLYSEPY